MEIRLWSVVGNSQALDGGAMFGNVPRALWSRWLPPDDRNRIPLACRALLARLEDGRLVLFETGIGSFFDPVLRDRYGVREDRHVLLDSLAALGTSHEEIDAVVVSHLHFDHAGGLLTAWEEGREPALLFPRARYIVGETAWRRARDPHPRDRASFVPALNELLADSGRLETVTGPVSETLGDWVRFSYSDGHTPGLMLSEIGGEEGGVAYCSDLIPGRPWVHLPVTMGYDRYPERLIDEKQRFLEDKLARGVRLYFTHDHEIALAGVTRDDRGRYHTADERAEIRDLRVEAGPGGH
jgi:glyoxylase-like metal-dependent hydrolase (beta-lactamase superfamily II)